MTPATRNSGIFVRASAYIISKFILAVANSFGLVINPIRKTTNPRLVTEA